MKITLTESLLKAALIGAGWSKRTVNELTNGFDTRGAAGFVNNIDTAGLYNPRDLCSDLQMLGMKELAEAVEKRVKKI